MERHIHGLEILTLSVLPRLMYNTGLTILIKITRFFFVDTDKITLKLIWKGKTKNFEKD